MTVEFEVDSSTVTGTVSTPAGQLAGGSVTAEYEDTLEFAASADINPDGSFSLTLPQDENYVLTVFGVLADGGGDGETQFFWETEPMGLEEGDELDLVADHLPLQVSLVGNDGLPRTGDVSLSCVELRSDREGGPRDVRNVSTYQSDDSDFELWGFGLAIDEGEDEGCELTVMPDDGSTQFRDITFVPGWDNAIEVVVPDAVTVSGTVAFPDTETETVEVNAFVVNGNRGRHVKSGIVAADGTFSLRLSKGENYRLTFDGYDENSLQFRLWTDEFDLTGDLTVEPAPWVPARVHLVDEHGDPAEATFKVNCQRSGAFQQMLFLDRTGSGAVDFVAAPGDQGWNCGLQIDAPYQSHVIPVGDSGNEYTWVVPRGVLIEGGPGGSSDDDGVPDLLEVLAPNDGDGNGDGTPDVDQPHVTSLPVKGSTDPDDDYLSIAAASGTTLEAVGTSDPSALPVAPPAGTALPAGLASFTLTGITPGSAQVVAIHTGSTTGVNGYAKYDADTETWSALPGRPGPGLPRPGRGDPDRRRRR